MPLMCEPFACNTQCAERNLPLNAGSIRSSHSGSSSARARQWSRVATSCPAKICDGLTISYVQQQYSAVLLKTIDDLDTVHGGVESSMTAEQTVEME